MCRHPVAALVLAACQAHSRPGTAGKFRFDVEIGLPGIGRLVRYRGWLTDR